MKVLFLFYMLTLVFFTFTESGLVLVSQFKIGEMKYLSEMCYVNGNVVLTGFTPETIRVYHEETGSILNQWKSCHVLPRLMVP